MKIEIVPDRKRPEPARRAGFALAAGNGLLAAAVIFFWLEAAAEDHAVDAFVAYHVPAQAPEEKRLPTLLRATHDALAARDTARLFDPAGAPSLKERLFPSVTAELAQPCGACASFARVYCRACQRAGFPARIIQVNSDKEAGGLHVATEVQLAGRWVYLDPLFNAHFRNAEGKLATFDEAAADWDAALAQTDALTRDKYRAQGFASQSATRTNWDKVPVLLPAAKGVLDLVLGKTAADEISLRSHFLNPYWAGLWVSLAALFLLDATWLLVRLRKRPAAREHGESHRHSHRHRSRSAH